MIMWNGRKEGRKLGKDIYIYDTYNWKALAAKDISVAKASEKHLNPHFPCFWGIHFYLFYLRCLPRLPTNHRCTTTTSTYIRHNNILHIFTTFYLLTDIYIIISNIAALNGIKYKKKTLTFASNDLGGCAALRHGCFFFFPS